MEGYKNVIYDNFNKCILIKRVNSTKFEKIDYEHFYYVESQTPTEYKDIFGRYMRKVKGGPETLKAIKNGGMKICESDLDPVTKFLHSEFDKTELNYSSKDFRICYFDIECQTGRPYYLHTKIKIKNKKTQQEGEVTIRDFEDKFNINEYLVYDVEKKIWSNYKGSCYHNTDFPDPMDAKCPINLLSCYSTVDNEIYMWGMEPYTDKEHPIKNYRYFPDELEMMKDWLSWFNKQKFDILSGYNSDLFDIPYICNRLKLLAERRGIDRDFTVFLSPLARKAKQKNKCAPKTGEVIGQTFEIPGLICLDYMDAYKKFGGHQNLPTWKLDYVAELELNEHKLEYEGSISEIYRKDWNKYVQYNEQDTLLLPKIDSKNPIMDMVVSFAIYCLVPLNKVFSMIATVEGCILRYIHSLNMVMSDLPTSDQVAPDWWHDEEWYKIKEKDGNYYYQNCDWEKGEFTFEPYHVKAGYVYACPGRYGYSMSGDITSSYPHQIMMYNISPETKMIKPTQEMIDSGDYIRSEINQVWYHRNQNAVLPNVVKKVFGEKEHYSNLKKQAIREGKLEQARIYENQRGNAKILANSIYGVCLNRHFHWFDIDNARAITRGGRVCIRFLKDNTDRYYTSRQILNDAKNYFRDCPDFSKTQNLVAKNREGCVIQSDTDSCYCCFDEYRELFKYMDDQEWFYSLEKQMNDFWSKILDIKAKKNKMPQLIIFNRENMFTHFFSFAKKLYIGEVVDAEGDKHWDEPKKKIKGVALTKTVMPKWAQEKATEICFDIMRGLSKQEAEEKIQKAFKGYKELSPTDAGANCGVHEYTKYAKPTEWYVKNGLYYDSGTPFNVKCAVNWNYVCAKEGLGYEPIGQGTKFKYVYLLPNNKYGLEVIGFMGTWPKEFNQLFRIDYETCFQKFLLPCPEDMFQGLHWLRGKETIPLKENKFKKFF